MAHRTCSAASHAAHTLLENFSVTLRPAHELPAGTPRVLIASEHHIGVIIDLATSAHEVAKVREPLKHWQEVLGHGINDRRTATQILYYVRDVVAALEKVPRYLHEEQVETVMVLVPSMTGAAMPRLVLTKAAKLAAKALFEVYQITSKNKRASTDPRITRLEVARCIDVCLGLRQALRVLPLMKRCEAGLVQGKLTLDQVVAHLRELGVRLEYLPNFEDRRDEVKLLA